MVEFTQEVSRKNCMWHPSFDHVVEDKVLDTSPQATDGDIVGTLSQSPGLVGEAADFSDGAEVQGPDLRKQDQFTVAFWMKVGTVDRRPSQNDFQRLWKTALERQFIVLEESRAVSFRVPGVDTSLIATPSGVIPKDEWTHVACVYDGRYRIIYINGVERARDEVAVAGISASLNDVTISHQGTAHEYDGMMDDPRFRRDALTADEIQRLMNIAQGHPMESAIEEQWDNKGIPLYKPNKRLAGALTENAAHTLRQADRMLQARHINESAGEQLDRHGKLVSILRKEVVDYKFQTPDNVSSPVGPTGMASGAISIYTHVNIPGSFESSDDLANFNWTLAGGSFRLWVDSSGTLTWAAEDGTDTQVTLGTASLLTDHTHEVLATVDFGTGDAELWVDGELVDSTAGATIESLTPADDSIDILPATDAIQIDEWQAWDHKLNETEIKAVFSGRDVSSGRFIYWDADDPNTNNLQDQSGNGNDGTVGTTFTYIDQSRPEKDAKYRARIKARMIAGRSSGTFNDLLHATASIVGTSIDNIEITADYVSDPGKAFVHVPSSAINQAELTATEIKNILNDAVPGGHRVSVIEEGSEPFELINDTMTNDPAEGLTSDSITSGGGLVSDV